MNKYQLEVFCFDAGTCDDYIWVELKNVELQPELLSKMADLGIVEIREQKVRADHVLRAYKALRLHRSLGVNLSGTAVILDLLDRMENMREELQQWKEMMDK